jgi:hypothetical protein
MAHQKTFALLERFGRRIGQRRDATRALTRVRTRGVALLLPRVPNPKSESLAVVQ